MAKKPEKKIKAKSAKYPSWWLKLTTDQQKAYIATHKSTKYKVTSKKDSASKKKVPKAQQAMDSHEAEAAEMKNDAIEALKEHPEHREELRDKIHAIAEDPESILPDDFDDKLSVDAINDLPDDKKKEITEEVKKINRKTTNKSFAKTAKKLLIYAGVGLIGGTLLATGTLPYAILVGSLLRDGSDAFRSFNDKIDEGQSALGAFVSSTSGWVKNSLSNPAVISSAIVLANKKKEKKDSKPIRAKNLSNPSDNAEKTDTKDTKTEDKSKEVVKPKATLQQK